MTTYPPKPVGDVDGTWAAIGRLQGYRQGLVAIQRQLGNVLDGATHLSGIYMLGVTTYRTVVHAEVGMAIAGVDATISNLTTAVRQLQADLRTWQATCDRIRAAAAAQQ